MTCAGGCCNRKDAEQDTTMSDQSPSDFPEPPTSIPIETSHRNVDNAVSTEPESESTASLGSCFLNSKPTDLILPSSRCSTAKPLTQTRPSSCCSPSSATQAKNGCKGELSNISDLPTNCTSTEGNGITSSKVDGTGGCCGSKKPKVIEATTPTTKSSCCAPKQLFCCTTTPAKSASPPMTRPCCPTERSSGCSNGKRDVIISTEDIKSVDSSTIDMEKGIDTARQHMIISISGMTCTGCETKLQRTLSGLRYVSNVQTSLVLARVELDVNGNVATADDIIKHLHRTTEFKCEVISNQGYSLDVVCSTGDAVTWLNSHERPDGVLDVRRVGKEQKTFRVEYDAKVIGARELLEHPWSNTLHLAPPCPDASLDAGSKHVRNMGLMTLLSAILTIPVLVMAWAPLPDRNIAYGSASLALATIVQVVVAGPFYPKALKALVFSRVIEMDLLIVLSTSTAYVFSIVSFAYQVSGRPLTTGQFFETSTLLVTLIMVGRWIASLARQKAAESISIRSLQTQTATLVIEKQDADREIDTRLLQFGDVFRVAPHSRVPTDGTVISGSSEIDESMLTGESRPVEKQVGSTVIAGSINGHGTLTVRLTHLPGDNTITTIASMVDKAKLSKPKIQEIADMIASYFVPVVVTLTTITFAIWMAIGVIVRNQSGSRAAIEAITYSITVLIVSCPCAIGLAVPMVIVIASGVAAKRGVVFKSAASIEVAYRTTDVVFDKTGTLTAGKLAVVREEFLGDDGLVARSLLFGLLGSMKHPVSAAIAEHLASQKVSPLPVTNAKVVTGKGVEASHNGKMLRAGNCRWLGLSEHPYARILLSEGFSTFCFVVDDAPVAIFGLRDTLRLDAAFTVRQLYKAGINVHILSGDDEGAVRDIATQLGMKEETVRSRCSPSDKQAYINELLAGQSATSSSSKMRKPCKPVVMFVGDGTNDAVALAQATIGVHISSGTDVAQSAADVVLVRPDLSEVLTVISVSRKAIHRLAFNFGWSFVYNLFAVLLGAGAFVHARIPPEFAGLGELVSVLPVVLAAVSLKWSHV